MFNCEGVCGHTKCGEWLDLVGRCVDGLICTWLHGNWMSSCRRFWVVPWWNGLEFVFIVHHDTARGFVLYLTTQKRWHVFKSETRRRKQCDDQYLQTTSKAILPITVHALASCMEKLVIWWVLFPQNIVLTYIVILKISDPPNSARHWFED